MDKGRIEAFSDGVIAILITIMVLELRPPEGSDLAALLPLVPVFLSYVLSFVFLAIYWNNHHHLFQVVHRVNGRVLWMNMHLLFWLSLISFVTAWMGKNNFAPWPVALYGVVLFMSGVAYYLLVRALLPLHAPDSALATAVSNNFKEKSSLVIYGVAIPVAFIAPGVSFALYVLVAVIWFIPDRRIERVIGDR
jgi:uncharacterized membrane protein